MNIRLVPPRRRQPAFVGTPASVAIDMLIGAMLVIAPWLGAVAIHSWVTH